MSFISTLRCPFQTSTSHESWSLSLLVAIDMRPLSPSWKQAQITAVLLLALSATRPTMPANGLCAMETGTVTAAGRNDMVFRFQNRPCQSWRQGSLIMAGIQRVV